MSEPEEPKEPDEQPGLFSRLLRATFAPDVLEDGGHDAPLTPRGRLLFRGTIIVLTVAVAILFVVTLANR